MRFGCSNPRRRRTATEEEGLIVRMPTVNRRGWLIHGVPRGLFGRLTRLGSAAQLSLLSLLGASAVLLQVL